MWPKPTITFIKARLPRMETAPLAKWKRRSRDSNGRHDDCPLMPVLSRSGLVLSTQVNYSCQTKLCTTAASTAIAVATR